MRTKRYRHAAKSKATVELHGAMYSRSTSACYASRHSGNMPLSEAAFEALCEDLRSNNEKQTIVRGSLPSGYGRRLGEALLDNTVVSTLELDLHPGKVNGENSSDAEQRYEEDNVKSLLQFLREAAFLRKVSFYCGIGTQIYTNPCLCAISQNANLQQFMLNDVFGSTGSTESANVLAAWVRTTKTLQHLGIPAVLADDKDVATALGANSSLVHLRVHGMDESSAAEFLRHVRTSHQSVLDTLQLCNGNLNSTVLEALSEFASSSTTPLSLLHLGPNVEMDAKLQALVAAWSSRSCMIARINVGDDPKTYKPLLPRES